MDEKQLSDALKALNAYVLSTSYEQFVGDMSTEAPFNLTRSIHAEGAFRALGSITNAMKIASPELVARVAMLRTRFEKNGGRNNRSAIRPLQSLDSVSTEELFGALITRLQKNRNSREIALSLTNLETAWLWYNKTL